MTSTPITYYSFTPSPTSPQENHHTGTESHDEYSYGPSETLLIEDPEVWNFAEAEKEANRLLRCSKAVREAYYGEACWQVLGITRVSPKIV